MLENMLDYIRFALYALLVMFSFLIYQAWDKDHPAPVNEAPAASQAASLPAAVSMTPAAATQSAVQPAQAAMPGSSASAAVPGQIITVKTDLLQISINTRGGDIVGADLLKFPESLGSKTPFVLLNEDPKTRYIAESGLLGKQGPDTPEQAALYTATQTAYTLEPGQNQVVVKLDWQNKDGLKVIKTYTFTRGSYEIRMNYAIENHSAQPWQGNLYTQLARTNSPPPNHGGMVNLTTYFGAAISTPQKKFEKLPFKDMSKSDLNLTIQDGWAAMIQHYFISAWVPPVTSTSTYYSRVTPAGLYEIGMYQPLSAAPGATVTAESKLYTGPTIADQLDKVAPSLKLTIDYGIFWPISSTIFWMMQQIYNVVGNWGWSIVLVTVIIKLLFYHLSAKSYRSMSAMKKLQPKIEQLKERFGDDKEKLTKATLELYRTEKVNPMAGCFPILIQIPVFIALYWVLVESVQLRQAPFIFWIHDLSQQDPYYILPVLMGISMFIQQRLNPPPPDPMQAKLMMMMPVIFTVMFMNFPAGLMLYWFVNNTLSFLQQWFVMRRLNA